MSINWEDSTTYQVIHNKGYTAGATSEHSRWFTIGEVAGKQTVILTVASERFGKPEAGIPAALHAIEDRERLQRIAARLLTAADWNDLLATS